MGKSGESTDWGSVAYENAYNAAGSGQDWGTVSTNTDPDYLDYAEAGYNAGAPSSGFSFEMPEFDFSSITESFSQSLTDQQANYDETLAEQQAQYDEEMAALERSTGESSRDSLYADYLDAAGAAADYVNSEISQEMSNARLLGIDYNKPDDEQKKARVSDYFSTVWGEGQQAELETLMSTWGNPVGFTEFAVTRGSGGTYDTKKGEEKSVATSTGQKPKKSILSQEEEEEDTLASASILGG